MKKNIKLLFFSVVLFASACSTDPYNVGVTEKTKDRNSNSEKVYGDINDKQSIYMKKDYEAPADAADRMKGIKERLYGKEGGELPTKKDSIKKVIPAKPVSN